MQIRHSKEFSRVNGEISQVQQLCRYNEQKYNLYDSLRSWFNIIEGYIKKNIMKLITGPKNHRINELKINLFDWQRKNKERTGSRGLKLLG